MLSNHIHLVLRVSGRETELRAEWLPRIGGGERDIVVSPCMKLDATTPLAWWFIESQVHGQESIEPAAHELLERFARLVADNAPFLPDSRFKVELDCTVSIDLERPLIDLSARSVELLARFGGRFSVEVYDNRG